jgi:hypothetical protein
MNREPSMPKRVYKFRSAKFGLLDLKDRRLKLSTLDDLNDPFDLCSLDITDPAIERALNAYIVQFKRTTGLLCFSRNWDNLLLWSHYANSHTGLCLGFDIPGGPDSNGYDMNVHYQPNLLKIRRQEDVNYDLANRLLRTKHESWSYEQELRMFVRLNDPPDANGLRWLYFGPQLELKEVIVGAQCSPEDIKAVSEVLKNYGSDVECSWAYMRKDAFLLVRYNFMPPWFAPPA